MQRIPIVFWFGLLSTLIGCTSSPTEPEFDLKADEARIPWDRISGKIAFRRTVFFDNEYWSALFIADAGARQVRLIGKAKGAAFTNLTWKPDGSSVVYADFNESKSRWQLYEIDVASGHSREVFPSSAHNNYPACSPGGRIAYWYNGEREHYQIWIDGAPFFRKKSCAQSRPAWAPDGRSLILCLADSTSQGSMYRVHLADTLAVPFLLARPPWDSEIFDCPIFSPDGNRLAYCRWWPADHPDSEIWMINQDGTGARRLTSGQYDWAPAWSPDGRRLAFTRGLGEESRIYLIDVASGETVQFIADGASDVSWLP